MNKSIRIILMFLLTAILTAILAFIDSDGDINDINQFYSPVILAFSFTISYFYPNIRKKLLIFSFILMLLMLVFYFTQHLDISNWFGSLGFGSLIFIIVSYLPELIRKGYVDRF